MKCTILHWDLIRRSWNRVDFWGWLLRGVPDTMAVLALFLARLEGIRKKLLEGNRMAWAAEALYSIYALPYHVLCEKSNTKFRWVYNTNVNSVNRSDLSCF